MHLTKNVFYLLLFVLDDGLVVSMFRFVLGFGCSNGELENPTSKENRWVMIVWNNHDVVRIFAPWLAARSTPFSDNWAFVLGWDVRMIVLRGLHLLVRAFNTCPPAASIIKCSAWKGGALLSATPLQMYTKYPPRTPPFLRASSPFSNVSFIEKLYAASAALSPKTRKSFGLSILCCKADCSFGKMS